MMAETRRRDVVICLVGMAVLAGALGPAVGAEPKRRSRGGRDAWQQPARVLEDLGLKPGSAVADIGCGSGYFTFRLARAVGAEGTVYATEISEKALKAVSARKEREKVPNIQTVLSEPTNTKLKDACVDVAVICNVLHHVPKEQRAALVKDIARAIRPGGKFFIIDWRVDAKVSYDKDRRIPREQLVKLATDAGLKLDAEFFYLVHQVFLRFHKKAG